MNKIDLNGRSAVVTGGAQGFRARHYRALCRLRRQGRDLGSRPGVRREDGQGNRRRCHRAQGRRLGSGRGGKGNGGHAQVVRQDRHSGQQCRHCRHQQDGMGNRSRRMAQGAAHQPRRALHLLQGDRARDAQPKIRPHRQHRLDRRQGRQRQCGALFRVQGRRDRADQVARQGTRRSRHRRQCGDPCRGQDRDLRPADASSISTSCCRRFRRGVSFWYRNWRRWWRGWPRRTARSPPARCSTFPAGARRIRAMGAAETP